MSSRGRNRAGKLEEIRERVGSSTFTYAEISDIVHQGAPKAFVHQGKIKKKTERKGGKPYNLYSFPSFGTVRAEGSG